VSDYSAWMDLLKGIPSSLEPKYERPFGDKGIVLNVPPQILVDGAVLDAQNLIATQRGLKKRPGTLPFTSVNVISDPPIQDAIGFWKVNGTQDLLVLGKSYLYKATPSSGYTIIQDQWEIGGRVACATSTVTGTKTKFVSAGVMSGDSIIIDADGSGGGSTIRTIVSVDSETQITISGTATYGAGQDFKISRPFRAANPWFVDWTVLTGSASKILFADGVYPVRGYDGTTLEDFGLINNGAISVAAGATVTGTNTSFMNSGVIAGDLIVLDFNGSGPGPEVMVIQTVNSDTSLTLTASCVGTFSSDDYRIIQVGRPKPHCVCYHKDRVWIANTFEGSTQYRQRIRWTSPGDMDNFVLGGWLDLPYTQGAIKKLVPLGDFLVAYFDDAIFLGRPASFGTNPMSFQQVETGGVGLLGMKAVTRYLDGHFFVGQDDMYLLTASGVVPIGSPVARRTIQSCGGSHHWMIQTTIDQINERVIFGFPKSGDEMEELWSYSYKAKAWTYDKITCQSLSSNSYIAALTWDTIATAPYSTGTVTGVSAGTTLTGSGTTWSVGVCATGDSILIDIDGDGNYEYVSTVASRTSNTSLEVVLPFPSTFGVGKNYRLVKANATWLGTILGNYPTWDSFGSIATTLKDVYIGKQDGLWTYATSQNTDNGSSIPYLIITKDYDLGYPDNLKFFGYFGLKLESWNDSGLDLVWTLEGSIDRGQNWKTLGNLVIPNNKDEGYSTFRMKGSIVRFRLTSVSLTSSFVITEAVLRARLTGREVAGRGDK
jgi:hypothetical protein